MLTWTLLGVACGYGAKANYGHMVAHTAGALSINDRASLTVTGGSGNTLVEKGRATGTLPGETTVRLTIAITTATSSFTLSPKGGSISGNGTVRLHAGKGDSTLYSSFSGLVRVGHGTGRYAHSSGSGNMYGVLNRRTDNAEVEVIGTLHD